MSNRVSMSPPFYILINDSDKSHVKYYHDTNFKNVNYEGEVYNYNDVLYLKGKSFRIGPRCMKHIETAIKFRNKIANVKKLDKSVLKVVLVEESISTTFKKIKYQEIKPFTFTVKGVFK